MNVCLYIGCTPKTNATIVDVNVDFSNALIDFKNVSAAQSLTVWPNGH